MRLFKRKQEDLPCCPECRERIPEGATECAMCGHELVAREARFEREHEAEEAVERR